MKLVIGIDEAGRGPLAGPVTVGAFGAEQKMRKWILKNIFDNKLRDSKKLLPTKREEIFEKLKILKTEGKIFFSVSNISNKIIDKIGISKAVQMGIKNLLKHLASSKNISSKKSSGLLASLGQTFFSESFFRSEIRLDGLLKAPSEFKNQKTIIKGDEKDVFIACASIIAKVSRDKLMTRLGKKYPKYDFEIHKGYGTKNHLNLIKKYGLSNLHRKSFCKNLT